MEEKSGSFLKEMFQFGIIALLVVFPVRLFIAQPFIVSGSSMEPTFDTGEYLIVDELTYHFGSPERGEVVVFRYPLDTSKFFIKRIIGLPGETVMLQSGAVLITKTDGTTFALEEPYLHYEEMGSDMETTLRAGEYFVMGDNRPASSDSRIWGPLPREDIVGRALVRLLPVAKADFFPGMETKQSEKN